MKKKNLVCVSALCALMSFSFVSCDDDNEPSLNIPNVSVTNVSFTDENPEALKVSGTLNWTAPSSVDNVTKYVIYGSSDGTAKDMKIAEVEVGTHSYAITDVVNIGYLLVIAANAEGESSVYASVRVIDFVKDSSFMALYFLNSGNMGNNNSSLYMYDIEKDEVVPDYFLAQNGRGLGDTAQDMIVYGDKMYIAVYGESTIEVTDLKAKSIKQVKTEGQPRYMVSEGGKVYISYYNGYVARLDTASLEVEAKVKVGRNPEQLAVSSNKLFVSNSGGMDYSTEVGYDKTVSVVDLSTFTEIKKLDVVLNPTRIQADEQGNVYVVSMGNYADIPNTVQKINTETYEVTSLTNCPNATEMAYEDGSYQMSILKSADGNGESVQRYFFDYPQPVAGEGHFISTYKHNGAPIPSFEGEPLRFACPRTIGDFAHGLWQNLNSDNKVSLFARVIDLDTGETGDMIFNKYDAVYDDEEDPEEPALLPEELEALAAESAE